MGAKKIKPIDKKTQQKRGALPPDSPLEKAKEWADKNYALIVGACAAVFFLIVSLWGFGAHDKSKQTSAQSAYAVLASKFPAEGKGTPADWEKLVPEIQKFISEHKRTTSALNARIELARAFFELKRYDDAIKAGKDALELAPAGHGLRPLITYQLAYAYQAAGKPDEAALEWNNLKKLNVEQFERQADYNLGRIYELKKNFAGALEMYQLASKAPGDYPPSGLLEEDISRVKAASGSQ